MNAPVKLRHRVVPAVAGLAVIALLATLGWQGYRALVSQPVKRVIFAGELDRLPHADLDALAHAVQAAERPGLAAIRESARRVPWARDASVRRQFPDTIEITFEAHAALARWNDRQLVSRRGDVFTAEDAGKLPRFRGPEGAAGAMAAEYPALVSALAPLASPVRELRLSARGAWAAILDNGMAIELGRGDWRARAQRFVAAWPRLPEEARATRHADLRYPNGFALRTLTPTLSQGRGRSQ